MASDEIDAVDDASLDQFRIDLIKAGFEPVPSAAGWRWRGPIAEPLKRLTSSQEMHILILDGWPFQPPKLLIPADGIDTLNGFGFGPDGFLYGPLFFQHKVVKIDVDADPPTIETVAEGFRVPSGVDFDSQGRMIVTDFARVRRSASTWPPANVRPCSTSRESSTTRPSDPTTPSTARRSATARSGPPRPTGPPAR